MTVYRFFIGTTAGDIIARGTENEGRVFTQQEVIDAVDKVAGVIIPGYTLYPAIGLWNRQTETSFVLEVMGEEGEIDMSFIPELKKELWQDCIMTSQREEEIHFW